jgi:hypothetical protein
MKALHAVDDLSSIESRSILSETTPSSELRSKISSGVKVENEVEVVGVMKGPP